MTEDMFMKATSREREQWLEYMKCRLELKRIEMEERALNPQQVSSKPVVGMTSAARPETRRKRDRLSLQEETLVVDYGGNPYFQPNVTRMLDVCHRF